MPIWQWARRSTRGSGAHRVRVLRPTQAYATGRNHRPRRRDGRTPYELCRDANPSSEELDAATERLNAIKARTDARNAREQARRDPAVQPYYTAAAYPALIAAGAVWLEQCCRLRGRRWMRGAFLAALMLTGTPLVLIALPWLPVQTKHTDDSWFCSHGANCNMDCWP